jgi:hypothetical protein
MAYDWRKFPGRVQWGFNMRRSRRFLLSGIAAVLVGALLPAAAGSLASAGAAPLISRPIVWVSGQDSGQVFITQGTTILKTFNFLGGQPPAPGLPPLGPAPVDADGIESPKPHLITFSPDGMFAYVTFQAAEPTGSGATEACSCVIAINTQTRQVVATISIPDPNLTLPGQAGVRTTEAKPSPDGKFLLVTQIGASVSPATAVPGSVTKVLVNEAAPSWTASTQLITPTGVGPGCVAFSNGESGSAYIDSTLSTTLGAFVLNPTTMTINTTYLTAGDPQCGLHDPIMVNGQPTVLLTDNGNGVGVTTLNGPGTIHGFNTNTDAFSTISPPSPITDGDLHDYWPVQLEPAGAPTTDPAAITYVDDRANDILIRTNLATGAVQDLSLPNSVVFPNGLPEADSRGAIDTLDGSGDTVFAALKEAGSLAIIDGFSKITVLHLANPAPGCGTVGNAQFHKCFAVHAVTVQPVLSHAGTQIVAAGTTLDLTNTAVTGSILVQSGGTLFATNVTVGGSVTANSAAGVQLCGSTVTGAVSSNGATGQVNIGSAAAACAPNTIGGSLNLINNTGGVTAIGNKVAGSVTASGNTGTVNISGNGP